MKSIIESACVFVVSMAFLASSAMAAAPASTSPDQARQQGPLAGLPNRPGAHVEKIKALGDNEWLDLGSPAADAKWGKARGRAWSCRMLLAPELRGAFIAGQGVHGFIKPDGHYQDDLFFYDINAHRWICVYPGTDVKNVDLTVNEQGFEVDKDGRIVPVAWCGHMYNDITYNTDLRKLMFLYNSDPYWEKPIPRRKQWLADATAKGRKLAPLAFPFYYNTQTGQFERRICTGDVPKHEYSKAMIYVPSLKKTFYWPGRGEAVIYFHDHDANTWAKVKAKGDIPPFGIDVNTCYDTKRQRIYLLGGSYPGAKSPEEMLFVYDLKTDTWTNPRPKGAVLTGAQTNVAVVNFDSVADAVVVLAHGDKTKGVYVYDPEANAWRDAVPLPEKLAGQTNQCWSGFYDPKLNAHFVHTASDSTDNGTMWAYRGKRAADGK